MVKQSGFYWSKRQWVAVASGGPYASLHLDPDRQPRRHPTTRLFTGRMPFLLPNQQCQSTEGIVYNLYTKGPLNGCVCVIHIHFWLFTLSQRKTNYTCTPYLNMVPHFHHINLWTAKLFFIWLKVCCVLSNAGGSEESQLWVVIGGSEKYRLSGKQCHRKCSEWPPSALIHASSLFWHDQSHCTPRCAEIQPMSQQAAAASFNMSVSIHALLL